MWCFYIRNKVTGEQECVFGTSWEDAKRRCPEIDYSEWYIELKTYED